MVKYSALTFKCIVDTFINSYSASLQIEIENYICSILPADCVEPLRWALERRSWRAVRGEPADRRAIRPVDEIRFEGLKHVNPEVVRGKLQLAPTTPRKCL